MFEFQEIKNKSEYNPLIISKNISFAQSRIFGQWQEMAGRKVRRFEIKQEKEIIGFFQIIKYLLPFGQSFLYIPHGFISINNHEFLKEFWQKLIEIGKEENTAFVKFDSSSRIENNFEDGELRRTIKKTPDYHYYSSYFQPKFEWIVNLTKTEEEILSAMHPKTRYNIGLAERKGIGVEIISGNFLMYFNDFYKLLEETARRDNFRLHPEVYYKNVFKTLDTNNSFLTIARYESNLLVANLILLYGNTAYFIFGGSSDKYKNLMAPHLVHWKAIKESKDRGFKFYNFGAVGVGNFEGISRFKKGFGGSLLEYSDSYDLVLKPFWYYLYNLRKMIKNNK